jgi:DNA-binding GntR family transcriptional regulator
VRIASPRREATSDNNTAPKRLMERASGNNMADDVRDRLEEEINQGVLRPGHLLDERQLAERFGVSRTPIREAILQLAAQGLVRSIPRSGVYVSRMSIKELLAMFELQAELEGICARFAARRMTLAQRTLLAEIQQRCIECAARNDLKAYTQANADFHEVIYSGSHNRYLAEQTRTIRRRTEIYRQNTFQREGRITASEHEHRRVVDAILSGDAEGACASMREHISVGGRGFAEFVSTLPDELLESHEQAYPVAHPDAAAAAPKRRPATPAKKVKSTRRAAKAA